MSVKIAGTGSAAPDFLILNGDLEKFVDTTDEWITTRTGIRERRILKEKNLLDIVAEAALKALHNAQTDAGELDMILCATLQGDYITPSLSCLLQQKLGANCPAFDINAACSGFIYALDVAASYFEAQKVKKVLIVSAEHLSKFIDWEDRSTCVLFGDGAGAAVLEEGDGLLTIRLRARGQTENLFIPAILPKPPFFEAKNINIKSTIRMNGQEIYKFAVSTITEEALFAVENAGITLNDIDYFVLHQANSRIIDAARIRLKQPKSKFPMNLAETGNTSSATIPVLLDELNGKGALHDGQILLLGAFGAGLTSGVCIIKWRK